MHYVVVGYRMFENECIQPTNAMVPNNSNPTKLDASG